MCERRVSSYDAWERTEGVFQGGVQSALGGGGPLRADRLVFGGEALWEQVRGLIAEPKGDEETGLTGKWSRE